jgi:prolyl-tRNA editing enzyme YbaK/EbsC (Cys-tRNA(Pro) deacylase)
MGTFSLYRKMDAKASKEDARSPATVQVMMVEEVGQSICSKMNDVATEVAVAAKTRRLDEKRLAAAGAAPARRIAPARRRMSIGAPLHTYISLPKTMFANATCVLLTNWE